MTIVLFTLLTAVALIALCAGALVIGSALVDTAHAPAALRPLWARLREFYVRLEQRLDNMMDAARADFEAERQDPQQPGLAQLFFLATNPDGTPQPLALLAQERAPEPTQPIAVPEPEPFFFLHEAALWCRFVPEVVGTTVYVEPKSYRKLENYCAFAFDEVLSPEAAFARAGLALRLKTAK